MSVTMNPTELKAHATWLGSVVRVSRCEICGERGIVDSRLDDVRFETATLVLECSDCFNDRMEMRYGIPFNEEAAYEAAMDAWASRAYAGDPSNEPDAYELAALDRASREQEARDVQDDPNYAAKLQLEGFVLWAKAEYAIARPS